jgi:hypothetical protein
MYLKNKEEDSWIERLVLLDPTSLGMADLLPDSQRCFRTTPIPKTIRLPSFFDLAGFTRDGRGRTSIGAFNVVIRIFRHGCDSWLRRSSDRSRATAIEKAGRLDKARESAKTNGH